MKKTICIVLLLAITAQAMVLAQQVTNVDLNTLVREYENNQLRASQLYGNKTIRVTGYAITITNQGVELGVRNNIAASSVFVYFNASERSKVANLNRGERITVIGVFDGEYQASIKRAVIETPTTAEGFRNRGGEYFDRGDYDRAIADYTQAIRLDPNKSILYQNRGMAYHIKRDYDRAIADFTQAIKLDPYYGVYMNRGNAYLGKHDYDRAIPDFETALQKWPESTEAKQALENARRARQQQPQAQQQPTPAPVPNNTAQAHTHNERGVAFLNQRNWDSAIAEYSEAIRLNPNGANGSTYYSNRGNAYYQKRDYDRAITDCTEAIRLNPNNASPYNNRAAAYNGKRDYDRAITDCTQAIRLDSNFANPYRHRAFAHMNKGNFTQARADVNKALQINPNYQDAKTLSEELRKKGY